MGHDSLERQLDAALPPALPVELREAILGRVHGQLNAAKWDRRLGRTAIALIVLGVGLNALAGMRFSSPIDTNSNQAIATDTILDLGATVAQATDAETGSRWARQLAALSGRTLTDQQVDEIRRSTLRSGSPSSSIQKGTNGA
jgi:hypothetical protein